MPSHLHPVSVLSPVAAVVLLAPSHAVPSRPSPTALPAWGAAAPPAQSIGTIEATLDGEERIWYVVSGEADGRRQPGAFWMETAPGDRRAVVGGFDTEDFDFSTVEFQGGMPVSLGDYDGSMISITFPLEDDGGEGTFTVPGADAAVTYAAEAGAMDFGAMLVLQEGVVETTRVETGGECRFEGRFSGTLRPMDGEGEGVRIEDGTFRVEGCEELTPG